MINHGGILMSFTTADKELIVEYDDAVKADKDGERALERAKELGKPLETIGNIYKESPTGARFYHSHLPMFVHRD